MVRTVYRGGAGVLGLQQTQAVCRRQAAFSSGSRCGLDRRWNKMKLRLQSQLALLESTHVAFDPQELRTRTFRELHVDQRRVREAPRVAPLELREIRFDILDLRSKAIRFLAQEGGCLRHALLAHLDVFIQITPCQLGNDLAFAV